MSELHHPSNDDPSPSSDLPESSNGSDPQPRSPYPRPVKPPYGKHLPKEGKRVVKSNGTFIKFKIKQFVRREWEKEGLKTLFGYLDESVNGYAHERPGLISQAALLPWMNGEPRHEKETDSALLDEQTMEQKTNGRASLNLSATEGSGSHHPETGSSTLSTHHESGEKVQPLCNSRSTGRYGNEKSNPVARAEEDRTTKKGLDQNRRPRLLHTATSERKQIHSRAKDSLVQTLNTAKDAEQHTMLRYTLQDGDWERFYALYLSYHEYVARYQFIKKPWNINQFVRAGVIGKFEVNFFEKGEA